MDTRVASFDIACPALRFRRWSRKRYAAFVSIHRAVTMGQLASHLADRLFAKQRSLHSGLGGGGNAPEESLPGNVRTTDVVMSEELTLPRQKVCSGKIGYAVESTTDDVKLFLYDM